MALKHSLAEKVMKWQYLNEQKSWVTGEKKIVKEEEWNPEINMDDAWSLLDGFIECVVMVDKVCGDNIYNTLIYFDKMNAVMDEADRREFLSHIIEKVEIHEEEQPNCQWLKSITFKLPIIPHDMEISLDKGDHVETVVLMSRDKE